MIVKEMPRWGEYKDFEVIEMSSGYRKFTRYTLRVLFDCKNIEFIRDGIVYERILLTKKRIKPKKILRKRNPRID